MLVVMLALAVPFHAAYAVAMAQCAARAPGAEHSIDVEHAKSHLVHSAAHDQSACEHGAADSSVSDTEDDHSGVAAHCSACSAGGTSIAIAGDAATPFAMMRTASHPSGPDTRLDGVTPSRLDRPPLPLL